MDHPSRSRRAAARDDDDQDDMRREDNTQMTSDLFLSLADSEQQASTPPKVMNFSRPRRQPSPESIRARLKLDVQPDSKRSSRQRFSETPSESTAETWATAATQQHDTTPNNIPSTDDDTITVNRLTHRRQSLSPDHTDLHELYMDETPTHDNVSETQSRDYASSRNKTTSPVSPLPPTGAPTDSPSSTRMWDELEAIKRRLRQLEMGSPLSGERPQTRGTTNSSSSPQRSSPYPASQAGTSITSSTSSPPSYPLLNAAITKVKSSGLSSDVAQAIEATAQEAMALALMTNHDPSVQAPSPRSIRRKVDGVCRGLTEVCLALADHQSTTQRQKTRAAQHRAEDAQDSSPLSATSRQAMTLSRTTARRLSGQTNSSTLSRSRRPAHSVVGITAEDLPDDDGISIVSRPSLSRYSTIQYRPPSRAATEVFRETTPPISNLQRYSTNRRSLLSRHGPSLSEYNIPVQNPASDIDSPHEEDPHPVKRSATFTAADADSRRRSLNLVSYFNSPPRTRATELSRESGLPTPPKRPVSLISPPRVNVASTFSSAERRDSTIRRRGLGGSVVGVEKPYETDIDELGRVRRNIGVASDLRRNASLSRKYGAREE